MSAASSRFRSAVRDLRPRGHAWWIIAGACIAGVLLFLVIFLVPHGARQVAIVAQQLAAKLKKN